jgi:hypothetical protein
MALDFPSSPATGQTYTGSDGTTWIWDGAKWVSGVTAVTAVTPGSPNFSVGLTAAVGGLANFSTTKIPFDHVDWDTGSFWNAGLSRFQPTVAGTYQIMLTAYGNGTPILLANASIYLNGAEWRRAGDSVAGSTAINVTALVKLNGTTDYIEGFIRVQGTAPLSIVGSPLPNPVTWMQGCRIGS